MKKETLEQMRDFEIFVERLEDFIDKIDLDGYPIEQYDFRMPDINGLNNNIYSIPRTIKDYAEIWQDIIDIRDNITGYYKQAVGTCSFLDLYWNDTKENIADFANETFWVEYDENGKIQW